MPNLAPQTAVLLISAVACSAVAATISGRIVEDHSGGVLASAEVRVLHPGASEVVADVESDADGHFELSNLPVGKYRVEVSKFNYTAAALLLRLTDDISHPAFITRLVRCGVISGQVLDARGQAVRGSIVFAMIRPAAGGPSRRFAPSERGHEAHVDESGEYRLYNLPPGRYAVAVTYGASTVAVGSTGTAEIGPIGSGVQYYPVNSQPQMFTISGGEEFRDVDFSIAPGVLYRVSGKVDVAAPELGFWIALTSVDQPIFATAVTQANLDGNFEFQGIPPGSYTLLASGPSHARNGRGAVLDEHPLFGRTPVEVAGDLDGISIAAQAGRSASFVLRNSAPDGRNCSSSMKLRLSPAEDWASDLDRTVTVNFTRPQRVDNLAPGRYSIKLDDSDVACYSMRDSVIDLSAANDAGPVAVIVAAKGSVHVRLSADRAQAPKFAVVLVETDSSQDEQPMRVSFADSKGQFTFDELLPGHYRIALRPTSEDETAPWIPELSRMQEVEVRAGATVNLELPIPASGGDNSPKA